MSLELKEAREKLDMLERLADEPNLIFTDLYAQGLNGCNFFYQVKINGKYILDYLIEHIKTLHVFDNTLPTIERSELIIYVPSINDDDHNKYHSKDKILEIDLEDRTFTICNSDLNEYEEVMAATYELKEHELDDFWKRYENLTISSRIRNAFKSLTSPQKNIGTKIADFVFHFIVSKKKVNSIIDRERNKIDKKNEYHKKRYESDISLQQFYLEHAPKHLEKAYLKQREIIDYLISLGYKEYIEMEG